MCAGQKKKKQTRISELLPLCVPPAFSLLLCWVPFWWLFCQYVSQTRQDGGSHIYICVSPWSRDNYFFQQSARGKGTEINTVACMYGPHACEWLRGSRGSHYWVPIPPLEKSTGAPFAIPSYACLKHYFLHWVLILEMSWPQWKVALSKLPHLHVLFTVRKKRSLPSTLYLNGETHE